MKVTKSLTAFYRLVYIVLLIWFGWTSVFAFGTDGKLTKSGAELIVFSIILIFLLTALDFILHFKLMKGTDDDDFAFYSMFENGISLGICAIMVAVTIFKGWFIGLFAAVSPAVAVAFSVAEFVFWFFRGKKKGNEKKDEQDEVVYDPHAKR